MSHPASVVLPGSRIGIFGGGQLGRMFTQQAQRSGYRVTVFSPDEHGPAAQVADQHLLGDYEDPEAVSRFARQVDVISLEFENIPVTAVARASQYAPVRPGREVLAVAQNRLVEKQTLSAAGFPVTPFWPVRSEADLEAAAEQLGWPMILKTATWGYDGKGQRLVRDLSEASHAWLQLGPGELIAERRISFVSEVSMLVARSQRGELVSYPLVWNLHRHHILDTSVCPVPPSLAATEVAAREIAAGVAETLQLCGLMCLEFFVEQRGGLLINEIAPRPHNSGHLTIEASWTSQFDQQLRAICNLPLGSPELRTPAAMVNLLGDVWEGGVPHWGRALAQPGAYLHLYGKSQPRSGRKMGHLTVLDQDPKMAAARARRLRQQLLAGSPPLSEELLLAPLLESEIDWPS